MALLKTGQQKLAPFIVIITVQYEENAISVFLHVVQNSYCVSFVYAAGMEALNKRENKDDTCKERKRERVEGG